MQKLFDLIRSILTFFSDFSDFIISIFHKVFDFFQYIYNLLIDFLTLIASFFTEIHDQVITWFSELVDSVPNLDSYYTSIYSYLSKPLYIANQFVNLDLGYDLFLAYLSFLAVFIIVKLTLKLIPTIG